jgi:hypothetical protein
MSDMGRFRIVCVNKNSEGDIIRVGIEGLDVYGVDAVINDIRLEKNQFYTTARGYPADVLIKPKRYGGYFLTTSPDGIQPNNLDYLPYCA